MNLLRMRRYLCHVWNSRRWSDCEHARTLSCLL